MGFRLLVECDTPDCPASADLDVTEAVPRRRTSPLLLQLFFPGPLVAKLNAAFGAWWDVDLPAGQELEWAHIDPHKKHYMVICAGCKDRRDAARATSDAAALRLTEPATEPDPS